jgi:hypothetical protein
MAPRKASTRVNVDPDHIVGAGEYGAAEGIDATGRRIITETAPVETIIGASLERENWKQQGAPSKVTLFFRNLLGYLGLSGLLRPLKRKSTKTRHHYEQRHDGYKRIHKL